MHIPTASAGVWVSQLEIGLVGLEVAMKMLVYMLFLIFFCWEGCSLSLTPAALLGVEPCGCPTHPNPAKRGADRNERCNGDEQALLR